MADATFQLRPVDPAMGVYDYLDFGCSEGGSLSFARDVLGGRRGLGLDIDPQKVAKARSAGFEALQMDVTALQAYPNCTSFVTMTHFLEHLPGYHLAKKCVLSGITAARDFVVFRQPKAATQLDSGVFWESLAIVLLSDRYTFADLEPKLGSHRCAPTLLHQSNC